MSFGGLLILSWKIRWYFLNWDERHHLDEKFIDTSFTIFCYRNVKKEENQDLENTYFIIENLFPSFSLSIYFFYILFLNRNIICNISLVCTAVRKFFNIHIKIPFLLFLYLKRNAKMLFNNCRIIYDMISPAFPFTFFQTFAYKTTHNFSLILG